MYNGTVVIYSTPAIAGDAIAETQRLRPDQADNLRSQYISGTLSSALFGAALAVGTAGPNGQEVLMVGSPQMIDFGFEGQILVGGEVFIYEHFPETGIWDLKVSASAVCPVIWVRRGGKAGEE